MSDYLGNLITRTLSQAAVVRPQLPSLFDPSVASGQIKSELEFEQETFSVPPPITPRTETAAPNPPPVLTPSQPPLGQLEPRPITHQAVTPAAAAEPEPIIPRVSRAKETVSAAEENEPSPKDFVSRSASGREESKSIPVQAETNLERVTPQMRANDSRANPREISSRPARAREAPISVSPLSTPDSQQKTPSLLTPTATGRKIRAVEAVVPAIRSLPQFPPATTPTINVTIGRVEIRATSPAPTPQRTRPKSANVLSLEEYLRCRASGGSR